MGWVYVVAALEVVALALVVVDIIGIRRRAGRALPVISLGMKLSVILAYVLWWLYYNVFTQASSMEDLAAFAGILVVSVPVLSISIVLDLMVVRALRRQRKGL